MIQYILESIYKNYNDYREKHYPYVSGDSSDSEECNLNSNNFIASINGYEVLPKNNLTEVMRHLSEVGMLFYSYIR